MQENRFSILYVCRIEINSKCKYEKSVKLLDFLGSSGIFSPIFTQYPVSGCKYPNDSARVRAKANFTMFGWISQIYEVIKVINNSVPVNFPVVITAYLSFCHAACRISRFRTYITGQVADFTSIQAAVDNAFPGDISLFLRNL